ncbi:unnamed protein product [Soboliphyme baturini]|uniref:TWiK family of potassium channels protein 7 n=1 Tax=Soboliphyme baturini TaxID=241478 RepID=A0A183J9E8_9BILA|nr:unnamed protein product [Soboliphyme baturini]
MIEEPGPCITDHRILPNSVQPFGIEEGIPPYGHLTSSLSDQKVPKWRKKLLIALPHLGLVVLSMLYTVLGAAIFYYIEAPNESILKWRSLAQINDIYSFFSDDLWQLSQNGSVGSKEQWKAVVDQRMQNLIETLHEAFTDNYVTVEEIRNNQTESVWSFTTSLFFTVTLITTIGILSAILEEQNSMTSEQ